MNWVSPKSLVMMPSGLEASEISITCGGVSCLSQYIKVPIPIMYRGGPVTSLLASENETKWKRIGDS